MGIKLVVAVTDYDWFTLLSGLPNLEEANFWSPSPRPFSALQRGELFLFKLHAPLNFIVGGGVFAHSNILPCSLAWETFGRANGADSLVEMQARIARYRREENQKRTDFEIGCRILTQPFFLPEKEWIPVPNSWSRQIVSFKTYSTDDVDGRTLWEQVEGLMTGGHQAGLAEASAPRYGDPVLLRPRLGQGTFRVLVTDVYERRCAVTGERTLPALDAAHIRPYANGGEHAASNGLLLRRDIHSLFDGGYVTVTPDLRFDVSSQIRERFQNGKDYYALKGREVRPPRSLEYRPDVEALRWHNEAVFLE